MRRSMRCLMLVAFSGSVLLATCGYDSISLERSKGPFVDVTAGGSHVCAIRTDGTVSCWGAGSPGVYIGASPHFGQASPPSGELVKVVAGTYHSCGLAASGEVVCWGAGTTRGECGFGRSECGQADPPAAVYVDIEAGHLHTCGITTDGKTLCWGAGETDSGVIPPYYDCYNDECGQSIPASGSFIRHGLGVRHSCGLRHDGRVECWGYLPFNEPPPETPLVDIVAGADWTCGLDLAGTVSCWGNPYMWKPLFPNDSFVQLSAQYEYTCALGADGRARCWTTCIGCQWVIEGPPDIRFVTVAAGSYFGCGVDDYGWIECWGMRPCGVPEQPGSPSWRGEIDYSECE